MAWVLVFLSIVLVHSVSLFTIYFLCLCKNRRYQMNGKVHTISPIYKSGDRSLVANYRPISLLCSVSKVLEKLVNCRVIDFLSSRLSNSQFGFLPGRSCLQQLLTFYSDIFSSTSSKCQWDVIFLSIFLKLSTVCHIMSFS